MRRQGHGYDSLAKATDATLCARQTYDTLVISRVPYPPYDQKNPLSCSKQVTRERHNIPSAVRVLVTAFISILHFLAIGILSKW
jgi:hypothetical protein